MLTAGALAPGPSSAPIQAYSFDFVHPNAPAYGGYGYLSRAPAYGGYGRIGTYGY